ncbi:hypothetical protein [Bacillus cereus]|uniref:hypothetical protein n=1 Tax=Bacillus cereus TaxID=1396 RepID=UPI003D95BD56
MGCRKRITIRPCCPALGSGSVTGSSCPYHSTKKDMERGAYTSRDREKFLATDTVWIELRETKGAFIVDSAGLLFIEE